MLPQVCVERENKPMNEMPFFICMFFRESMASFEHLCTTFPEDNCMVTGREILTEVNTALTNH